MRSLTGPPPAVHHRLLLLPLLLLRTRRASFAYIHIYVCGLLTALHNEERYRKSFHECYRRHYIAPRERFQRRPRTGRRDIVFFFIDGTRGGGSFGGTSAKRSRARTLSKLPRTRYSARRSARSRRRPPQGRSASLRRFFIGSVPRWTEARLERVTRARRFHRIPRADPH